MLTEEIAFYTLLNNNDILNCEEHLTAVAELIQSGVLMLGSKREYYEQYVYLDEETGMVIHKIIESSPIAISVRIKDTYPHGFRVGDLMYYLRYTNMTVQVNEAE